MMTEMKTELLGLLTKILQ